MSHFNPSRCPNCGRHKFSCSCSDILPKVEVKPILVKKESTEAAIERKFGKGAREFFKRLLDCWNMGDQILLEEYIREICEE